MAVVTGGAAGAFISSEQPAARHTAKATGESIPARESSMISHGCCSGNKRGPAPSNPLHLATLPGESRVTLVPFCLG